MGMDRRVMRRAGVVVVLGVMGAVFSWLSAGVRWNGDVLAFFSSGSAEVGNVRAAVEGGGSEGPGGELRIDVHGVDGKAASRAAVEAGARELAERLRGTGLFRWVWSGVDPARAAAAYGELVGEAPVLEDVDAKGLEGRMSAGALEARFAAVKGKLADPDGELLLRQLQGDPLGLGSAVGERLRALAPGGEGSGASLDDGVLAARDSGGGWHAMVVAEPVAAASDMKGAEQVVAATDAAVAGLKGQGLAGWVVGAHRGYVENAQRVKRDVMWVSAAGTVGVALLIAGFFRRVRAAALCMIPPSIGVGIALGIAGIFRVELPLLLLGFAGLLCGSTTDYGIQLIAECRRLAREAGGWREEIPWRAARRMVGPISMSVATSVTGFAALGLSEAPGLRAMGLFVAGATVCIWVVTFAVIPVFLGPWVLGFASGRTWRARRWIWWVGVSAFVVVTVGVFLPAAGRVRFNADARRLDGSSAALLSDEDSFYKVWGDIRNQAVVLVSAPTAAGALEAQERVADYLGDLQRDGRIAGVTSAAGILPDEATAAARVAAWKKFWTQERRGELRDRLAAAARANGFAPAAFAAYADRVAEVAAPDAERELKDSPAALLPGFISKGADGSVTLAMVVRMNPVGEAVGDVSLRLATAWAKELRLRFEQLPGIETPRILSGNVLLFDATDRARAEAERFAPWCLVAILVPLWIYYRSLRRAWLVTGCLVVGFVWVLGAAGLMGGGLNLLSLVPLLFTLGVAVDYGVYAAAGARGDFSEEEAGRKRRATALCAMTTIVGSGALVLAGHPALRWLGLTLVAGIAGGYLTALFVVGPVVRWSAARAAGMRRSVVRRVGGWVLTAGLAMLTVLVALPPLVEWRLSAERPAVIEAKGDAPLRQIGRRQFAVGDSWMRYRATSGEAGIWEIRLAGTPAERGRAVSLLASPLDCRIESEMLDQLDTLLPAEWSRWLLLRAVGVDFASLPAWIPAEDQQELYAAATSYEDPHSYLAPTYSRLLAYHALHDVSQMLIDNPLIVPNTFACTGVVSLPGYTGGGGGDGHLLLGRDFDFEGGESFGRQKSVTLVIPPDGEGIPYAHVAWPGLEGCVTGMNREKIALFINAAATKDFRRIGTPTILMAREVLEQARSIADAERIIRGTQVFVSDILVVADGKTGQARVFEKSPGATAAYDVDESVAVTNHLVTPTFADDPVNKGRISDSTTMQRYQRARELLDGMKGSVTPEKLAGLLRDKKGVGGKDLGYGNRNAIDGLIACHSVIMDVTAGRMWVAGWPNAEGEYLCFDVLGLLSGRSVAASAPKGEGEDVSRGAIPADRILTDGPPSTWQRVLEGRRAGERAQAAFAAGDLRGALAAAEEVVAANPGFYLGHALRGRALFGLGRYEEAKAALERALDADPPYAARRKGLEELLEQCKKRLHDGKT
ncbi:MAG TPA: C45 family autoproteolytic acyltransferase/hydrolase [Phycisphaerae bacterium]|nr:C45 family autoproteolytic acyltransferase/hydrolase [Phycisphaerae bacterium]